MNDNGTARTLGICESVTGKLLVRRLRAVLHFFLADSLGYIAFSFSPDQEMMIMRWRWWWGAEWLQLGSTLQRWVNKQTTKGGEYWERAPTERKRGIMNDWMKTSRLQPLRQALSKGHTHKVHFQSVRSRLKPGKTLSTTRIFVHFLARTWFQQTWRQLLINNYFCFALLLLFPAWH